MAINSEENMVVVSFSVVLLGYFLNPQGNILKIYKT